MHVSDGKPIKSTIALDTRTSRGQGQLISRLEPLGDLESRAYRFVWLLVLAIFVALYAMMLATFWAPADGGVDQNAYLVGGKQLAQTLSTKFTPANPFQYVGQMFVMNAAHEYY